MPIPRGTADSRLFDSGFSMQIERQIAPHTATEIQHRFEIIYTDLSHAIKRAKQRSLHVHLANPRLYETVPLGLRLGPHRDDLTKFYEVRLPTNFKDAVQLKVTIRDCIPSGGENDLMVRCGW
jgi:hypothetical protein